VNAYQRQGRASSAEFFGELLGRIETAEGGEEEG
jgi:hypothetical protein